MNKIGAAKEDVVPKKRKLKPQLPDHLCTLKTRNNNQHNNFQTFLNSDIMQPTLYTNNKPKSLAQQMVDNRPRPASKSQNKSRKLLISKSKKSIAEELRLMGLI